ncbi:MAG: phosphate uptake regulator PhoU, partial [Desulfovibrionales bacterium]|nr:phosphate uptake regulator PhoU [Desulfovibrionales bacterium]
MQYFKDLEEKIHFMILEVTRQLENTQKIIDEPESELVEKVKSRDDHIDNYKAVIENICFSRIHGVENLHKQRVDFIRAVNIISNNLERISDYAVNIVGQLSYLVNVDIIKDYKYHQFFKHMLISLEKIVPALFERNLNLALEISKAEFIIDKLYKVYFDIIIEELDYHKNKHDLVTCLFIFRYLERMG